VPSRYVGYLAMMYHLHVDRSIVRRWFHFAIKSVLRH